MKVNVLFLTLLIAIVMTGCSAQDYEKKQLEEKTEKLLIENNRLLEANISLLKKLKDAESQLSNVKAKLDFLELASESANLVTLFDVSFSPNDEYATVVFTNHLNDERPLYLYNISEHTNQIIYCDNACGVIWSPDSQHFVIDQGTSVDRMGSLYSLKDNAIISTIGYMGSLTWINSSEVIYAEENKSVELDAALEILGTTDVIRRNIITGESKILFSGTDQFYYMVLTNDTAGDISIIKRFVGKDSQNKVDERIIYSSKN
jgi:hypothetical protein